MDCLADLLSQKGLEGAHAWCEQGLKLRCRSSGEASSWIVLGRLPEEEGEGMTAATACCNNCKADNCANLVHLSCSMSFTGCAHVYHLRLVYLL